MTCFVGLDVSQMTAICVADNIGRRRWRGQCPRFQNRSAFWSAVMRGITPALGSRPERRRHGSCMNFRNLGLEVVCLHARHARTALEAQINKTDQNDAEGLAQIVRTGWYEGVLSDG
jgi:transposase